MVFLRKKRAVILEISSSSGGDCKAGLLKRNHHLCIEFYYEMKNVTSGIRCRFNNQEKFN